MRKENSMMTEKQNINRTAHLLALMKKGDGAFNARDFAAEQTGSCEHQAVENEPD